MNLTSWITLTVIAIGCLFAAGYLAVAVRYSWMADVDDHPAYEEDHS